jgi:hypothetical protein
LIGYLPNLVYLIVEVVTQEGSRAILNENGEWTDHQDTLFVKVISKEYELYYGPLLASLFNFSYSVPPSRTKNQDITYDNGSQCA